MKTLIISILAVCASTILADDGFSFKTVDGTEYKSVTVTRVTPASIQITYADGVASIPIATLPADLQKRLNYDPERAAKFEKMQADLQQAQASAQASQAQAAALQQKIAQHNSIIANLKTVLEVESDQSSFVGKPVFFQGDLEISSYYNYGYEHAQDSHFAFDLTDSSGRTARLYMKKGPEADTVRSKLLRFGGSARALCMITIIEPRYEKDSGELLAELFTVQSPIDAPPPNPAK
ncbi:MAG TPA: hypothetical protein VGM54_10190 [Chthoniobacter sp.]|jgi:hypothetical protein